LACAAIPEKVQIEQPVRLSRFRLGFEQDVADLTRRLVGGDQTLRLVWENEDHFEATVTAETGTWWRESQINLMVHPASRGQVEKQLVSHALHHLRHWHQRVTLVRHPTYHPEAIETFKSFGFREERTLLWMRREL